MVTDPAMQWALTLVFTATAVYALVRIGVDRAPVLIVGNILHLVMSVVMITMSWPWGSALPAIPQIVVFAGGAAWYLALVPLQLTHRLSSKAVGGHGGWHQLAHALMMIAMVWMVLVMPSGGAEAGHTHQHGQLDLWASLSGVAVTAAMLVAGAIFVAEVLLSPRGHRSWLGHDGDLVSGAAMSLGMAAMCWPMITG